MMGEEIMMVKNNSLTPISLEEVQKRVSMTLGWRDAGQHDSFESALQNHFDFLNAEKAERQERNAGMMERIEAARTIERQKALDLIANQPIESTVENIRIIANYLNEQNWGGWSLPKMTIGYSAHQYDCDGSSAVTITLDKGISDEELEIKNVRKFKVGGKRGHLEAYRRI